MTTWDEYRAQIKVSPGDIVDMHGLPWVLDLTRKPDGYRTGTYRCLNCGYDPYDPHCCRQVAIHGRPPEWTPWKDR